MTAFKGVSRAGFRPRLSTRPPLEGRPLWGPSSGCTRELRPSQSPGLSSSCRTLGLRGPVPVLRCLLTKTLLGRPAHPSLPTLPCARVRKPAQPAFSASCSCPAKSSDPRDSSLLPSRSQSWGRRLSSFTLAEEVPKGARARRRGESPGRTRAGLSCFLWGLLT